LSLWVVVDELSELLVDNVILDWDVDGNSLLKLDDVVLEGLNLNLGILELSKEFEGSLVGLIDFLLKFKDVV
jgi:hypothetical protein